MSTQNWQLVWIINIQIMMLFKKNVLHGASFLLNENVPVHSLCNCSCCTSYGCILRTSAVAQNLFSHKIKRNAKVRAVKSSGICYILRMRDFDVDQALALSRVSTAFRLERAGYSLQSVCPSVHIRPLGNRLWGGPLEWNGVSWCWGGWGPFILASEPPKLSSTLLLNYVLRCMVAICDSPSHPSIRQLC